MFSENDSEEQSLSLSWSLTLIWSSSHFVLFLMKIETHLTNPDPWAALPVIMVSPWCFMCPAGVYFEGSSGKQMVLTLGWPPVQFQVCEELHSLELILFLHCKKKKSRGLWEWPPLMRWVTQQYSWTTHNSGYFFCYNGQHWNTVLKRVQHFKKKKCFFFLFNSNYTIRMSSSLE